jgi:hypothetical protein
MPPTPPGAKPTSRAALFRSGRSGRCVNPSLGGRDAPHSYRKSNRRPVMKLLRLAGGLALPQLPHATSNHPSEYPAFGLGTTRPRASAHLSRRFESVADFRDQDREFHRWSTRHIVSPNPLTKAHVRHRTAALSSPGPRLQLPRPGAWLFPAIVLMPRLSSTSTPTPSYDTLTQSRPRHRTGNPALRPVRTTYTQLRAANDSGSFISR